LFVQALFLIDLPLVVSAVFEVGRLLILAASVGLLTLQSSSQAASICLNTINSYGKLPLQHKSITSA
jgi:hypothetical protein